MMVDPFWASFASPPPGLRAGSGGSSASDAANTLLSSGREPVLLDALSLLRCASVAASLSLEGNGGGDKEREASGGDRVMKDVSVGSGGIVGAEPESVSASESKMAEAIEPGSLDRLSEELSVFNGRGGTTGGCCLNGLASGPLSAVGESCSLDREYLRKWLPPVAMREGARLEVELVLALAVVVELVPLAWRELE